MTIKILDEAQEDLIQGFRFYESQELGLGAYFLDCLFSDIDSLPCVCRSSRSDLCLSPLPVQAFPVCDLLQFGRETGSRACCVRLSQASFLGREAFEEELMA